jgi:hypothetical protein
MGEVVVNVGNSAEVVVNVGKSEVMSTVFLNGEGGGNCVCFVVHC